MALVPITAGVGIATVYDVDINTSGLIFAGCGVIATAVSQIFTNTYQKSLDCNAIQLLYHSAPIISIGMLVLCPFFDDIYALREFQFTTPCLLRIALSCIFAIGVNVSNYLVIGKTSPLTYQVLGHLKTVLIIVLGFTVFNKELDSRECLGMVVAMVGVMWYTEIRRAAENEKKKQALPL